MPSELRIGSYNLYKNAAAHELEQLAIDHELDVLCLQECDSTKLPAAIGPLQRAASTERNRLGLAIYHREDAFSALETAVFTLPKSFHDYLMSPGEERLLAIKLVDRATDEEVVVASFHAAPLTTMNSARRRQIKLSHQLLAEWAPETPMLMVGDYNYPLFHGGLQKQIDRSGHELTFSDSHTYKRYRYIRGHFDFVTSLKMTIASVATLPKGASDHMPILVKATALGVA
ncbi:endonuclease/exonuclease/phosphatase family protein [Schumannella soli]|uniref:endonuclease/exonuclease/phosphatase family protein n=1 Tax=Schumannella soli TaxID=2590779 RepID=UPI0021033043|nr:endonuclease/exonuclease/phosphatase family protein [Schumannella soli]